MILRRSTFRRLHRPAFVACAALGLALLVASLSGSPASAFTFNNADGSSGNDGGSGDSGYKDIDVNRSRLNGSSDSDAKSATGQPKTGFYFSGAQSLDRRYNADHYFDSNVLMGR